MDLLEEFIAVFPVLDDHRTFIGEPIWWDFAVPEIDMYGFSRWRPLVLETDASALVSIRHLVPGRLPRLYECLVLRFRWPEVDLGTYRLTANPVGPGLEGLVCEVRRDRAVWDVLSANRYFPFGKSAGGGYDPICFDLSGGTASGDSRVVQIDHERVLCRGETGRPKEIAPSFEALIENTLKQTRARHKQAI